MPARSKEEVIFGAHLLHDLGLECTPATLIKSLKDGARDGLYDQRIELSGTILYVDYDGGYYHTEDRIEQDEAKSLKKIGEDENALVLRVRVKAPPLTIEHERLLVVHWDSRVNPSKIMHKVAQALKSRISEPYASAIAHTHSGKCHRALTVARDAIEELFEEEKRNLALLEAKVGETHARELLKINGAKKQLENGVLLPRLEELHATLTYPQIVKFMCPGVMARLQSDEWMDAFTRFRECFSTDQIVRLMCGGIAARLESKAWLQAFAKFCDGYSTDQIVRLMCESIATRLESKAWLQAFAKFSDGFSTDQIVRLMCGGIAARLESKAWLQAFAKFCDGFSTDQIVKIMCNSIAARLESKAWLQAFAKFSDGFSTDQIVKLMCDSIATRLESKAWLQAFAKFCDGFSTDQIVKIIVRQHRHEA